MSDDIWKNDDGTDELADAARIFEELDTSPQKENIGDILYVDGIEDDESVIDEEVADETETLTAISPSKETQIPGAEAGKGAAQKGKPLPSDKTYDESFAAGTTETSTNDITIEEFFLPLVRQLPPSKIRIEHNTIGSFFEKYIEQDET